MTIKVDKATAVEKITSLRRLGLSSRVIAERMGLSKSRILAICRDFAIPKWPMDTRAQHGREQA
jgi:hypothetical protein